MTHQYFIQKNTDTTQVAGAACHCIKVGDGLTDADCPEQDCCGNHATYTNPVWQVKGCLEPSSDDTDYYYFGSGDMQMAVPKADCFDTESDALAECSTRNA